MSLRYASSLLLSGRHRKSRGVLGHHDGADLAPVGPGAVLGGEAVTPIISPRLPRAVVSVRVPNKPRSRFRLVELLVFRPLNRIVVGGLFVQPDQRRGVQPYRRTVGGPVADFIRSRLTIGDTDVGCPGHGQRQRREHERTDRDRPNSTHGCILSCGSIDACQTFIVSFDWFMDHCIVRFHRLLSVELTGSIRLSARRFGLRYPPVHCGLFRGTCITERVGRGSG